MDAEELTRWLNECRGRYRNECSHRVDEGPEVLEGNDQIHADYVGGRAGCEECKQHD